MSLEEPKVYIATYSSVSTILNQIERVKKGRIFKRYALSNKTNRQLGRCVRMYHQQFADYEEVQG